MIEFSHLEYVCASRAQSIIVMKVYIIPFHYIKTPPFLLHLPLPLLQQPHLGPRPGLAGRANAAAGAAAAGCSA